MEKEKTDDFSPRGVLEAHLNSSNSALKNKNLGLDFGSPEDSTSETDLDSPDNTGSLTETTSESDPSGTSKKNHVESFVNNAKSFTHWSKMFKMWKRRSIKRLSSFPPFIVPKLSKGKSGRSESEEMAPVLSDIYNFKSTLQHFSLSDLQTATDNFNPGMRNRKVVNNVQFHDYYSTYRCYFSDNMIGRGGYAEVYRGCLKSGQLVAVKQLTRGTCDERTASFLSELGIIAHVHHPRTAKLVGCGVEGGMHLVFQLSPLGSLGSILHGQGRFHFPRLFMLR